MEECRTDTHELSNPKEIEKTFEPSSQPKEIKESLNKGEKKKPKNKLPKGLKSLLTIIGI